MRWLPYLPLSWICLCATSASAQAPAPQAYDPERPPRHEPEPSPRGSEPDQDPCGLCAWASVGVGGGSTGFGLYFAASVAPEPWVLSARGQYLSELQLYGGDWPVHETWEAAALVGLGGHTGAARASASAGLAVIGMERRNTGGGPYACEEGILSGGCGYSVRHASTLGIPIDLQAMLFVGNVGLGLALSANLNLVESMGGVFLVLHLGALS